MMSDDILASCTDSIGEIPNPYVDWRGLSRRCREPGHMFTSGRRCCWHNGTRKRPGFVTPLSLFHWPSAVTVCERYLPLIDINVRGNFPGYFDQVFSLMEKLMAPTDKPEERKRVKKQRQKTMDELRKPATTIGPTEDEFRIVSPGPHEPEGQTTHE